MDELLGFLKELKPELDFARPELISSGVLDSLDLVYLVTELGERYQVDLDADDMRREHFEDVASIYALLKRKGAKIS